MDAGKHVKADNLRGEIYASQDLIKELDDYLGNHVEIKLGAGNMIKIDEGAGKDVCKSTKKILEARLKELQKLYEEL